MLASKAQLMGQEHAIPELVSARCERLPLASRAEFTAAIEPLTTPLFRLCYALTGSQQEAEDLLQNALVKAYVHRASYRGEAPFLSWLYGIVRRERAELVRRTARRRSLLRDAVSRVGEAFQDLIAGEAPSPESLFQQAVEAKTLLDAVRALPDPFREVVWMCDVEELPYEQVAQALDVPVGTVKSRHARGRGKLAKALGAGEPRGGEP